MDASKDAVPLHVVVPRKKTSHLLSGLSPSVPTVTKTSPLRPTRPSGTFPFRLDTKTKPSYYERAISGENFAFATMDSAVRDEFKKYDTRLKSIEVSQTEILAKLKAILSAQEAMVTQPAEAVTLDSPLITIAVPQLARRWID